MSDESWTLDLNKVPKYQSHKVVRALRIAEGMFEVLPNKDMKVPIADGGFSAILLKAEVTARHYPQPGDYVVFYEDGYISISPKKAFDEGYRRI